MPGSERPLSRDERASAWLRKFTHTPTTSLFRVINFELHNTPRLAVALPGTLLFGGCLAYLASQPKAQPRVDEEDDEDED